MRLVLHREIPDATNLRCQWDALVQRMECPEVFYTYEWALAMSRAYCDSMTPLLFLGYEQDSLVGVASLATDNFQSQGSFLAGTTADYCDFVSLPQIRAQFVQLILRELQRLRLPSMVLANLPQESATVQALAESTARLPYSFFSRPAYRCPQVIVSTPEQRQSTKRALLHKQMIRRHLKAIAKLGPVEVRHLRSGEEIERALPQFEQAQITRFSAAGRTSNLARRERREFLSELAKLLSESNLMTLSYLTIGDRPIAWNYGFQFAGSWFWHQPGFDVRYRRYYPGLCLLVKIIEQACDTPEINRVDLGLGNEGYKQRFTTHARQTLHVTMSTSKIRHLRERARYHASAAIKASPVFEHWVRRLLGRASNGARHA